MIDAEKLAAVIAGYKDYFPKKWPNEKYKWEAIKNFQDHWDIQSPDFSKMLDQSMNKTFNLLSAMNFYPLKMIKQFSVSEPETIRSMFLNLYDEKKDLTERVDKFQSASELLVSKYTDGTWKQHYQNANAISTYLWLRYPDKYYIYKYTICLGAAKELGSDFVPKKGGGTANLILGYKLYDEICEIIQTDETLKEMLESQLTETCYPDTQLRTLTIDIAFYTARYYPEKINDKPKVVSPKPENSTEWFPADYTRTSVLIHGSICSKINLYFSQITLKS